ncbi:MAG: deoxyhypusine synthase [Candidatus Lokiarchaeota archaeon]|nr:deoxyhypusine synthase [Candidatus Lokiarchaeota archaeon]
MRVILLERVFPIKIKSKMSINELILEMKGSGAFGAGRLARAVDIYEKMMNDKNCIKFFGLAGALVPGGMRQIIVDMLKEGYIDVFVTTGASLTHDLIEAINVHHLKGASEVDDVQLREDGLNRIFDIYLPNRAYEQLEDFIQPIFKSMIGKKLTISNFIQEIGSKIKDPNSILRVLHDKKIPVYCPAIADSGLGLQAWNFIQMNELDVQVFDDLKSLIDLAWDAKITGVCTVGGGVPKNHILQALQFSSKTHNYAIQITMDRPEPGGLSGATLKEGISWGKIGKESEYVDVICDATIALPLLFGAVKERLQK